MNEIVFKIPIYNFKIKLVIVDSIAKYTIDNKIYTTCSDNYFAIVIDLTESKDYTHEALILFTPDSTVPNTIAHEAFHICCLIMRSRLCTLTESSEEAFAYLLDYIVKELNLNLIKLKQLNNGNTDT